MGVCGQKNEYVHDDRGDGVGAGIMGREDATTIDRRG